MFECPKCGSEHDSEAGLKIHWGRSDDHEGSIAGTEVDCDVCGTTFRKQTSLVAKSDRHFCNDECKSEGYKNRVTVVCDWCDDEFERRRSHLNDGAATYCSNKCQANAFRDRLTVECENCGEFFDRKRSNAEAADTHFCSVDCRGEYQQGQNHPNWRGGPWLLKTLRRHVGEFKWRNRSEHIEEGSPLECEMCGASKEELAKGLLDVHHIVPVMAGGSNWTGNLLVLCRSCHRKADTFTYSRLEYPIADAIEGAT